MADRPCAVVQARPVALAAYLFRALLPRRRRTTGPLWRWPPRVPPRSPEQGVLHTVVRTHLDAFLQEVARAL
jgi:hypothetical protein